MKTGMILRSFMSCILVSATICSCGNGNTAQVEMTQKETEAAISPDKLYWDVTWDFTINEMEPLLKEKGITDFETDMFSTATTTAYSFKDKFFDTEDTSLLMYEFDSQTGKLNQIFCFLTGVNDYDELYNRENNIKGLLSERYGEATRYERLEKKDDGKPIRYEGYKWNTKETTVMTNKDGETLTVLVTYNKIDPLERAKLDRGPKERTLQRAEDIIDALQMDEKYLLSDMAERRELYKASWNSISSDCAVNDVKRVIIDMYRDVDDMTEILSTDIGKELWPEIDDYVKNTTDYLSWEKYYAHVKDILSIDPESLVKHFCKD